MPNFTPQQIAQYPELDGATVTRDDRLKIIDQDGQRLAINGSKYYLLPNMRNKYFSLGRVYSLFNTVQEFLASDSSTAVVPMVCINRKKKGRRYFVEILDEFECFKIFNVEMINGNWVNNEHNARNPRSPIQGIEICERGKCYTFLLVKEPDSVLGFRVRAVKK